MKNLALIFLLALFHIGFCCADNKIVAVVGQDIITQNDLDNRVNVVLASNKEAAKLNRQALRLQILQGLINEKIFLQEAKKQKIEPTEEEVTNAIKNIEINEGMTPDTLIKKITATGVPKEAFLNQIRNSIIWDKLLTQVIASNIEVSNEELLGFISHNKPDKVHIDAYLVSSTDTNQDASYKNLKKIWDRSQNCAAFKRAEANKPNEITTEHIVSTLSEIQNLKTQKFTSELHKDQASFIYEDQGKMNFIMMCNKRYDMNTREMTYFDNILKEKKLTVQADYYVENLRKHKFIEIYDVNGQ